jgi:predicted nucleic acid-binding protein
MNSVFDTNILIYHLNDALSESAFERMLDLLVAGAAISVITRMEILGTPKAVTQFEQTRTLLDCFTEQPLTEAIVQRVIALRQQHRIKLPDAIIAATALQLDAPLVTRNTGDFINLPGLRLIDIFDTD